MYVQVLLREEETKMALDDADIKAVELDAQKALLEQVGTASNLATTLLDNFTTVSCTCVNRSYFASTRKLYNS